MKKIIWLLILARIAGCIEEFLVGLRGIEPRFTG